ncbi:hypothetical protein CF326_g5866 [Tilletia indica]|nr:hypothetical protein CF326_g5866 [Tilletia indica]
MSVLRTQGTRDLMLVSPMILRLRPPPSARGTAWRRLSTSSPSSAKDVGTSPASPSASHAAFEKRRILEELRLSNGSKASGAVSSRDRRVLDDDTIRRAQISPSSLAAAASLGAADSGRPSLLDKLTAEGKPWKELGSGQKVARGTRYTTRFLLVIAGGTFTLAVVYTLATELFAPNSPTVIYADAIRRVKRHDTAHAVLLEPLRFLTHPPRNDMTDPSETLLPLPASARSTLRAHKPVVVYSLDGQTGREVMRLHFWIIGRERGTELGWFEEARGWTEHQVRQASARLQEAWERFGPNGTSSGTDEVQARIANSQAKWEEEIKSARGSDGSSITSYLTMPFRAVGSMFGAVTRSTSDVGVSAGESSDRRVFGRRNEPGTFTTAEVVAELEKDDAGVFQYRTMYMRVPHDSIMAQRIWVIKKKGEVVR